MRKFTLLFMFLAGFIAASAQQFSYTDAWGNQGFNLADSRANAVQVVYSINSFALENMQINGVTMKNIMLPGSFLTNDAGAPNLPGSSRFIAIPEGATPRVRITAQRTDVITNVDLAPAMELPLENDDSPLKYVKNPSIYGKNQLYPAQPVQISEVTDIRGVDAVILGITPFQYNPVTRELLVYRDLKVTVEFEGGSGEFGDVAFRSPYWDPILMDNFLNFSSLPKVDYAARSQKWITDSKGSDECEYIIITPTSAEFLSWADTIAKFRNEQGILTKIFTTEDVGGNSTAAIEAFINNAYNSWTIKPAACLILGDFGTNGTTNVIAPIYNNYCASDNIYADVNSDHMPDVVFARMTANNNTQLTTFITKFLNGERNPITDPYYYNHPITALGWQTERWFQLCSEIVGGYFLHAKGRTPVRINALYQGNPNTDPWSTAQNTSTIINTFGPNGLAYIPSTPQELGGFTGGTASQVNAAIEAGAFILQHRDHGMETGWGEPSYTNGNITPLANAELPHIFSINCLTGKYNWGSECFTEKFHRHTKNGNNAGALSVTGASETSYSFVNDTYVWGMLDNMWPDFMPQYGSTPAPRGILPAFGNAAGKYFLKQSSWPYNTSNKQVTYHLFHHHGDAFQVLYDTVPMTMDIAHDTAVSYGTTVFNITANDSAFICLSVEGEIIAVAYGDGATPVVMTIPALEVGTLIKVTVTKQNFFRYEDIVPVSTDQLTANFAADVTSICTGNSVNFSDLSSGSPTAWEWTFEGGVPSTSTEQNPQNIVYEATGDYSVTLTVTKEGNTMTETKTAYIHVYTFPEANFSSSIACENTPVDFTDLSLSNGGTLTGWQWDFGDPASGANNTSTLQNPAHQFTAPGVYSVTLTVLNNGTCSDQFIMEITNMSIPGIAATPEGDDQLCQAAAGTVYTTAGATNAATYAWILTPASAGTLTGNGMEVTLDLDAAYTGSALISVQGVNDCGTGTISMEFPVTVTAILAAPAKPEGPDTADVNVSLTDAYSVPELTGAESYTWTLLPEEAGTITGTTNAATVNWNANFRGIATISVSAFAGDCSGFESEVLEVLVRSTLGVGELNGLGVSLYPNPTSGKFNLILRANGANKLSVKIYNVLGNIVYSDNEINMFNETSRIIDLSGLPKGIYHLKAEGMGQPVITRIVLNN